MQPQTCLRGQPWPLGATPMKWQGHEGVNLAVFSRHATAMHCCLFDADTSEETARARLRNAPTACGTVSCRACAVGQLYGLRASGPYQPAAGHRFNRPSC